MHAFLIACAMTLNALDPCGEAPAVAPPPSHHTLDGRFRMPGTEAHPKGLKSFLKWRWEAFRRGYPHPPATPTPRVPPDLAFLHANAQAGAAMVETVTWLGHSSVLIQTAGLNVLLDPILGRRASPVPFAGPKRALPPGLSVDELPHIDLVLISHNHYDHLDAWTLKRLARQKGGSPRFQVPLGLGSWFKARNLGPVQELDWWESTRIGALEVMFTPSRHWSSRSLTDRMRSLWGGFALLGPHQRYFYPGDTGYGPEFREIGRRLPNLDLALLPIGAYAPRWFMAPQHIDPFEAVQILEDLGAKEALAVHWGTFQLTDEPLDEPPKVLAEALTRRAIPAARFHVLPVGGTLRREPMAAGRFQP